MSMIKEAAAFIRQYQMEKEAQGAMRRLVGQLNQGADPRAMATALHPTNTVGIVGKPGASSVTSRALNQANQAQYLLGSQMPGSTAIQNNLGLVQQHQRMQGLMPKLVSRAQREGVGGMTAGSVQGFTPKPNYHDANIAAGHLQQLKPGGGRTSPEELARNFQISVGETRNSLLGR